MEYNHNIDFFKINENKRDIKLGGIEMKYSNYNLLIPYKENVVLFNTLSGDTFLLDQETGNAINNKDLESIPRELKQQLI